MRYSLLLLIMQNCQRSGGAGLVIRDLLCGADSTVSSETVIRPTNPPTAVWSRRLRCTLSNTDAIIICTVVWLKWFRLTVCLFSHPSVPTHSLIIYGSHFSDYLHFYSSYLQVTGKTVSNSHPGPKLFLDLMLFSPHHNYCLRSALCAIGWRRQTAFSPLRKTLRFCRLFCLIAFLHIICRR